MDMDILLSTYGSYRLCFFYTLVVLFENTTYWSSPKAVIEEIGVQINDLINNDEISMSDMGIATCRNLERGCLGL